MASKVCSCFIVFFTPDKAKQTVGEALFCMGRSVITCGLLFSIVDFESKTHGMEIFYADKINMCLSWYTFNMNAPCMIIDNYDVNMEDIQGILVSDETELSQKIYNVCRACYSVRKDYNVFDRVLSAVVPFYAPVDDADIYDASSLHSAQAVVLILRSVLDANHAIRQRLQNLNSRTTTPERLRDDLLGLEAPHGMFIFKTPTLSGAHAA